MRRDAFVPAYKQRRLERERRAAVQAAVQVAGERLRQALTSAISTSQSAADRYCLSLVDSRQTQGLEKR